MKVRCPSCKKVHSVGEQNAPNTHTCDCGAKFKSPASVQTARATPVKAQATTVSPKTVACDCGKKLRIPASAFGKKVKCPCGQLLEISQSGTLQPKATPPVLPQDDFEIGGPDSNWLDDLPAPNATASSLPQNFYSAPTVANSSPPTSSGNPASSTANRYLAQAEVEQRKESVREHTPVDWSLNGGILGGVAMIIGAIVWFFAGLAAGYIFFYPPFLLFAGAAMIIRSIGD